MAKLKYMTSKQVKEKLNTLRGARGTWTNQWQDIADFIVPRKNNVTSTKADGEKRNFQVLDNTAMNSNELLAGALHGLLTNPYGMWFEYTTGDLALDDSDNVRIWLQDAARRTHHVINNSNFQTEVHELYIDMPSFGTGCMLMEEDKQEIIRFSTKFIAEYFIEENHLGKVDRIYREWKWSADKIVAEYGIENCPKEVVDAFKAGAATTFMLVHSVYPASIMDETAKEDIILSQHTLVDLDKDLRKGTFSSFPYVAPRWSKASGETYGRSPGMTALPEIKILNKMSETMLIGAQKVVDPPVQLPDDGFILPLITRPGGINFYRAGSNDIIKPIFNDTRIDFGEAALESRRKRVRDAYYVDQLQLQQQGPMMTATEVMQRTEEKMRLLGPMLGRMQSEFLRPMIDRVFDIMLKRNMFLPIPTELNGKKIDVRYSSFIARAQRSNEAQGVSRFLQAIAPFISLDPSVADNLDGDSAIGIFSAMFGTPAEIVRPKRAVQAIRTQKAQAAQQAQQAAQMQQGVETAAKVTKTAADIGGLSGGGGQATG